MGVNNQVYLVNITGAYQVVLPYSCALLQSYCQQDAEIDSEYIFMDYIFHVPDGVTSVARQMESPAVLGLSLLSWNRRRSLKLAKLVKQRFPECLIVVGGPDVPDVCAEFLEEHSYLDLAVHKEGEQAFLEILRENLKEEPDWSGIGAVSYRNKEGKVVTNPRRSRLMSPIDTPSPILMGLLEPSMKLVDSLNLPRHTIWETNRGCPFSCTYCDWGSFTNQKVRPVNEDRIFEEIEYIGRNFDEVHIADANFGILARDLKIAEKLAKIMDSEQKLKSVHITYTKNLNHRTMKIAELMESRKPSRAGFTFGIQSYSQDVLKNVKRDNIPVPDLKMLKRELDGKGIPSNTEMILGLPGETRQSFLEGIQQAFELDLTDLRVYQVSMYPNSEMNSAETISQFEIEVDDVLIVEGAEEDEDEYISTVVKTRDLSRDDFYFLKKYVEMIDHIHFGKWTYYLAKYFRERRGIREVDFYRLLGEEFLTDDQSVLGKIAKGVYINRKNSGSWNAFRGPDSPFGIEWGDNFFRKGTFFWLCIAEDRKQFFSEIRRFLRESGLLNEEVEDLIRFQDSMIIDFEYDPQAGKQETFFYNWFDYFFNNHPLVHKEQTILYQDKTVGRFNYPLKARDPQSYFYVAGGYKFHFQKIDSFEFNKLKVSYRQDSHEQRFQFKDVKAR